MSRQQKEPLRALCDAERMALFRLSRSQSAPAAQVARARALLAVAVGQSYTLGAVAYCVEIAWGLVSGVVRLLG